MSFDTAADVGEALKAVSVARDVALYQRLFKTGPGQYGEGDIFIGVKVPKNRAVAKRFRDLPEAEINILLHSPIHEERFCGLVILIERFRKARTEAARAEHFQHYLDLVYEGRVNNWDLVDVSAPYFGAWLIDPSGEVSEQSMHLLRSLASSDILWERRVGIIFTFAFIRAGVLAPTFEISEQLLGDKHDLMHKAVGWMLREAGKKDAGQLREFLSRFAATMPRTALRYAIEKFDEVERKSWLSFGK